MTVLPLNEEAAHTAAQIYQQLRPLGQLIEVQDTLVAGICMANEVPLLTRNVHHYGRVHDLQIIEVSQIVTNINSSIMTD